MAKFGEGVLLAFTAAGGNGNKIFFSPDGKNIGAGELRYDGSSHVQAMVAYKGGVFAAFQDRGSQSCGGGLSDLGCTINKSGGQLLVGIGNTAVSIVKNPAEILPVCWGSPQDCRDPVTARKGSGNPELPVF
jgi:hypothetical protein